MMSNVKERPAFGEECNINPVCAINILALYPVDAGAEQHLKWPQSLKDFCCPNRNTLYRQLETIIF